MSHFGLNFCLFCIVFSILAIFSFTSVGWISISLCSFMPITPMPYCSVSQPWSFEDVWTSIPRVEVQMSSNSQDWEKLPYCAMLAQGNVKAIQWTHTESEWSFLSEAFTPFSGVPQQINKASQPFLINEFSSNAFNLVWFSDTEAHMRTQTHTQIPRHKVRMWLASIVIRRSKAEWNPGDMICWRVTTFLRHKIFH